MVDDGHRGLGYREVVPRPQRTVALDRTGQRGGGQVVTTGGKAHQPLRVVGPGAESEGLVAVGGLAKPQRGGSGRLLAAGDHTDLRIPGAPRRADARPRPPPPR
jgi:hypothetical protein